AGEVVHRGPRAGGPFRVLRPARRLKRATGTSPKLHTSPRQRPGAPGKKLSAETRRRCPWRRRAHRSGPALVGGRGRTCPHPHAAGGGEGARGAASWRCGCAGGSWGSTARGGERLEGGRARRGRGTNDGPAVRGRGHCG